jgi:hypothetical protein
MRCAWAGLSLAMDLAAYARPSARATS